MERIKSPAIKCGEMVYLGKNHAVILREHSKEFINTPEEKPIQGFITSADRFVGRVDAAEIAIRADQVIDPKLIRHCGLMSEDLKSESEE